MASLLDLLPIDLIALTSFVLEDPFAQSLVSSSANNFFEVVTTTRGRRVTVRGEGGSWSLMPQEWRDAFAAVARGQRREVLRDLANGKDRDDYAPGLRAFLRRCGSLSLDRTVSPTDTPIISYPPATSPLSYASIPVLHASAIRDKNGKIQSGSQTGMTPKKLHEVIRFGSLVGQLLERDDPPTHAIDIGSGRAHLSRTLSSAPCNLHVVALDWSVHVVTSAELLDSKKAERDKRQAEKAVAEKRTLEAAVSTGSLEHRTSQLDELALLQVMQTWPENGVGEAMLVALHACGDLTIDALKAFMAWERGATGQGVRKMVCVGCCHHLQTIEVFPLSSTLASLPMTKIPLTKDHLMLSPQSPPTWHLDSPHINALQSSILKLIYRARFEAEMYGNSQVGLVGRSANCPSYEAFRTQARIKLGATELFEDFPYGLGEDSEEEWEDALWQFQIFWTIRSWLGPPVESLVTLDRYIYCIEQMRAVWETKEGGWDGRRIQLVNLFEQATGSLRNLAIVVR